VNAHTFIATADNFLTDVIEASRSRPVLVDFWAEWCGPCKQLMPVLELLVEEYAGRFALAKVNTDEQQPLAAQVGVRSLPTVVLFKDGNAVDHFVGVVPESHVRQLLEKHLPPPQQSPLDRARILKAAKDFAGATAAIEKARETDKGNLELLAELGELRALSGDIDAAREFLKDLESREPNAPPVKRLSALIEFIEADLTALPQAELESLVAANPSDLEARNALAVRRLLAGDADSALHDWLALLRSPVGRKDERVRKALLSAFELLDKTDPRIADTRRAMASLLF
jgi:putative thioredoxin